MLNHFYPTQESFSQRDSPVAVAWGHGVKTNGYVAVLGPDQGLNTATYGAWICKIVHRTIGCYDLFWKGQALCIEIRDGAGHANSVSARVEKILHALKCPPQDDSILEQCNLDEEPDAEGLLFWLFGHAPGYRRGQEDCTVAGLRRFWNIMLQGVRIEIILFGPDKDEARRLMQVAEGVLNCTTISPNMIRYPDIWLPEGSNFVFKDTTNERFNEVTTFFHVGEYSDHRLSACRYLEGLARDMLTLRKDMTLAVKVFGIDLWFQVQIRHEEEGTSALDSSIEQFLAEMHVVTAILALLVAQTEDAWGSSWQVLQTKLPYVEGEANGKNEVYLLLWACRTSGDYSEFPTSAFTPVDISLLEVIECFAQHLSPNSNTRARLSVHISQRTCHRGEVSGYWEPAVRSARGLNDLHHLRSILGK